ncbi:MAG TPA: type II toxin-antitoxin system prevent-host-death family antitoxin [Stellaceae bacterium]|jgi:prevent-host-death family protein|nr:type II toxin-antitoxin system prevent-host-death family antitoxin [Stellaceae bacterium]
MREVGAFDAKNKLGQLLDLVEQGEEIMITRHGRPVARLVSAAGRVDRDEARAALRRIRERAERLQSGAFDWEEWKELRDTGRPLAPSSTIAEGQYCGRCGAVPDLSLSRSTMRPSTVFSRTIA